MMNSEHKCRLREIIRELNDRVFRTGTAVVQIHKIDVNLLSVAVGEFLRRDEILAAKTPVNRADCKTCFGSGEVNEMYTDGTPSRTIGPCPNCSD